MSRQDNAVAQAQQATFHASLRTILSTQSVLLQPRFLSVSQRVIAGSGLA
jgi:hypothetical protein